MNNVFKRYEKKFLIDERIMEELLPEVSERMEPDSYSPEGRTYSVCNLYFDTEDYDVIRESLAKPYYKEKLRLRSYGMPEGAEAPVFLEMKKKVDKIVTKRRVQMSLGEAEAYLKRGICPEGASFLTRQVLGEIDSYLDRRKVGPRMRITYDRTAYYGREDRQVRLTFDRNLRVLNNAQDFAADQAGDLLLPETARLMEVKVKDTMPLWLARMLSGHRVYTSSFSKYGVAYRTFL